jgi:hypothetical protein
VKLDGGDFCRRRVSTAAEQRALLAEVRRALSERSGRRSPADPQRQR